MTRTLVFSGGGDYVDPWHPFAETSALIAQLLEPEASEVLVVDRVAALERELPSADLLIVNAGGGPEPHPLDARLARAMESLRGGLLVLHVAATLLPEVPEWEHRLGGRWVRGQTMHPARGALRLRASADPLVADLDPLDTVDEAYSWLRVDERARVLCRHEYENLSHPVVWTVEAGGRRCAYSALGHDVQAYDAPAVRELLRRLARWSSAS